MKRTAIMVDIYSDYEKQEHRIEFTAGEGDSLFEDAAIVQSDPDAAKFVARCVRKVLARQSAGS